MPHLVLTEEELSEGIDTSTAEWRMAYAHATSDYAEDRARKRGRRRAALVWERKRATVRFVALVVTLLLTVVGTTVAMFEALYLALE